MKPIDVAIDDYMHLIARTRPWTIKREEEFLEAFSDWLYEQPAAKVMLNEITRDQLRLYAAAADLSSAEQDELGTVLNNVYRWSIQQGWAENNPFRAVSC